MRTDQVVPFLAFLICLVAFADCARDFLMHNGQSADGDGDSSTALFIRDIEKLSGNEASSYNQGSSPADYCSPCLEISKRAQSFLNDPALAGKIEDLAGSICHLAPFDFEAQCKDMVGEYKKRAITFLQEEVLEEKFCNATGFCRGRAQQETASLLAPTGKAQDELHSAMEHLSQVLAKLEKVLIPEEAATVVLNSREDFLMNKLPVELGSNATCSLCMSVLGRIRNQLDDPDKQLKIITSLIKACETEVFTTQCKKMVFAYGPMVITNLQRLVSLDLCHTVRICDEPKNQTTLFHGKLW